MNSTTISATLEAIEPIFNQIEDPSLKEATSVLFNLIESSVTDNIKLRNENQSLKDEINRLKGEQGKPDIKANTKKNTDISSEQERKEAEAEEASGNREGFKFDKASLEKLKEQRLPIELLLQLESMIGEKYLNEKEFIERVELILGKELTVQHRPLLLKYARYKKRNRKAKIPKIKIDRYEQCFVDKSLLPEDAKPHGYEKKVVQDVIIKTDNIEFQREVYYSKLLKKTYVGAVPKGYDGDFGPHIKANIISMKYVNGMSNPKIVEFYHNVGTLISSSYVSNRLTKPTSMEVFHQEKSALYQAGLEMSSYVQIDDTGTRVNGKNYYTQIICNDLYTVYFTTKRKDRLTILDVLRGFESRNFLLNDETFSLLEQLKVSKIDRQLLSQYKSNKVYDEDEIVAIMRENYRPDEKPRIQSKILEACAITSYRQETGINVVKILVCDDAPQFKLLTDELALCWIHEGRHYKRLNPIIPLHQEKLNDFLKRFWGYYRQLFIYKKNPDKQQGKVLSKEFDTLFSTKTGYDDLDRRIEKTQLKKSELLVVLKHPEVPLHNNKSENGARVEKRRQDVSLQTKTDEGTHAKDTMMSIVETCKKLGISAYKFIHDRVSGKFEMPSLAEMIRAKALKQAPP